MVSEGAEDEDELFIEEDEGSDVGEDDELEAVIAGELAKFQQQQEQKYAQLEVSGGAPAVLPSPAPAQQQLRAEERQAALTRDAAVWAQQERSEYVPPVRPCTAAAVGPAARSHGGRPASAMPPPPSAAAAAAGKAAHQAAGGSAGRNADARPADGSAAGNAGDRPEPAVNEAGSADAGNASQSLKEARDSSAEEAVVSQHQPGMSSAQAGSLYAHGPADEQQGDCRPPAAGILQSARPQQPSQHPAVAVEHVLKARGTDHQQASAVAAAPAAAAEPSAAGVEEEEEEVEEAVGHRLGAEPVALQAADADAEADGFIYQDDDGADASSGCSSPLAADVGCAPRTDSCSTPDPAPVAAAAVAAAATSRPGAGECERAGQAGVSSCCFLTSSEGEPSQRAGEQQHYRHQRRLHDEFGSPWPVSDGRDGSPLPGCGGLAVAAATAERGSHLQHPSPPSPPSPSKQRPVHSRNRPTGRGSPALEAVAAVGGAGGCSGARVQLRPGSAPSVPRSRPLSPSKHQGSRHSSGIEQQCAGSDRGWLLGGGAGPAGAQLLLQGHRACHGSLAGSGGSQKLTTHQTGSSSGDSTRPHTSTGISWTAQQATGQLAPNQQQPVAALWAGWAASPGPGSSPDGNRQGSASHSSRAALQPLMRGNTARGQAAAGSRPRSANTLRARSPASHVCADARGASSRIADAIADSSQRIRPSSSSSRAHQQGSVRMSSHQQELQAWQQAQPPLRGNGGCWPPDVGGSLQHGQAPATLQQQQQLPARQQPAWNSSPIPLCTPKTVPIGAATLSPEALLHSQHNQHSAASGQLLHGSAGCSHWQCVGEPRCCFAAGTCSSSRAGDPSRPHTAGAASAACGEGQGRPQAAITLAGGQRPVSGGSGNGSGPGGSSGASAAGVGRSVYLVDILGKVRQANNCCRRLGLADRQFRLARSDKQRWQLEQIEVEVWQQQQEEAAAAAGAADGLGGGGTGWQLQAVLTLVQFNKQLAKLTSRAAAMSGGGEGQQ